MPSLRIIRHSGLLLLLMLFFDPAIRSIAQSHPIQAPNDIASHKSILTSASTITTTTTNHDDDNDEAEILMRVKAGLDPDGRILHSWFVPGGSFEGVSWNEYGRVANISLQGKGLYGFIPSSIAELTSLSGLYLHYNHLSGPVPAVLYKLSGLTELYLNVNSLSSTIPSELGLLYSLQALQLCCNKLEGSIPMELGALKQLTVLALQHNELSGEIPSSLGYLESMSRLDLSYNKLNGSIPEEIGDLKQLTMLDVTTNSLSGPVPQGLRRLKQGFLYSNNSMLCGDGFTYMSVCSSTVTNQPDVPLPGSKTTMQSPDSSNGVTSAAESADVDKESHVDPDSPTKRSILSHRTTRIAIISAVSAFAGGAVVISLLMFVLFRRHKQKISSAFEHGPVDPSVKYPHAPPNSHVSPNYHYHDIKGAGAGGMINHGSSIVSSNRSNSMGFTNSSSKLDGNFNAAAAAAAAAASTSNSSSASSHRITRSFGSFSGVVFFNGSHQSFQYDLEELEMATNFFSDKNLLGKKGAHSAVYKGILKDGSSVAIRALNKASCKVAGVTEFKSMVAIIAQLRHESIVSLKGFCCSSGKADFFLVYDFMTNGTLQEHLEKIKPAMPTLKLGAYTDTAARMPSLLDWTARSRIATAIARGLHFMHKGTENVVLHQNISAANVLLDENCNACLSDAGLHRLLADDIVFSVLKASAARGYLSPEYVTTGGRLTEKSDVYALGVLLLQLLTGETPLCSLGHHEDHRPRTRSASHGPPNHNNMVSWARSLIGAGCVDELMDPSLKGKFSSVAATHMAAVAFACTHEDPVERPDTTEVVRLLQKMDACAESVLEAGLSSGEDYTRRQQALFAERLLDDGR